MRCWPWEAYHTAGASSPYLQPLVLISETTYKLLSGRRCFQGVLEFSICDQCFDFLDVVHHVTKSCS